MSDHGFSPLGRFDSARDSILHFLCISDWAEDSSGNTEAPTGYFWRITNDANDVAQKNTEFNSIMEDWFTMNPEVTDSPELRAELVGHFIVQGMDSGAVYVSEYETEDELMLDYVHLSGQFEDWDEQED